MKQDLQALYGAEYYRHYCGETAYERSVGWLSFFGSVAENIIRALKPAGVFDAGCAVGLLVESLWDLGVHAEGVDVSEYANSQVRRDIRPFCRVGSLTEPIEGRYDLVTCIEVLEHIPSEECVRAMANITAVTDTILFSSTPLDLKEKTHFNVRPVLSWLRQFSEHGFYPDLLFDASFVSPQAMLLRRSEPVSENDLVLYARFIMARCQLHESKSTQAKAAAELAAMTGRLADLEQLVKRQQLLEIQLHSRSEHDEALQAKYRTLQDDLASLQERFGLERTRLQRQYENALSHKAAIESSSVSLQSRLTEQERLLHDSSTECQRLQSQNRALEGSVERLQKRHRSLSEHLEQLRTPARLAAAIPALESRCEDLTQERDSLKGKAQTFESELDVLRNEVVVLKRNIQFGERRSAILEKRADHAGDSPLPDHSRKGEAKGHSVGGQSKPKPFGGETDRNTDEQADYIRRLRNELSDAGQAREREIQLLETLNRQRAVRTASGRDPGVPSLLKILTMVAHRFGVASPSVVRLANEIAPLVDPQFYRHHYIGSIRLSPALHYLLYGADKGYNPHPLFDSGFYLNRYPDVAAAQMNPLLHYMRHGALEGRWPNPYFDAEYYRRFYRVEDRQNPLLHYLTVGMAAGHWPNAFFDINFYRRTNKDLTDLAVDLFQHFVVYGTRENRLPNPLFDPEYWRMNSKIPVGVEDPFAHFLGHASPVASCHPLFDCTYYSAQYHERLAPNEHPLGHFLREGAAGGLNPHALFDTDYYRRHQAKAGSGGRTLFDYLAGGEKEKQHPHPLFDQAFYLESNPDVRLAGFDPLIHFVRYGARELRNPHPLFDMRYYLSQNPHLDPVEQNLLAHYLQQPVKAKKRTHPLFDPQYVFDNHPEIGKSGKDPLSYFLAAEGGKPIDPNTAFDTEFYLKTYGSAFDRRVNPLVNFVTKGAAQGWRPNANFDPVAYAAEHHDCKGPAGALAHYLKHVRTPSREQTQKESVTALLPVVADRFSIVKHTATVSIVVCVHNALEHVKRCLSSLIEHTFPPYEIILVDDGSADPTRDYLREFAKYQGAILARNENALGYTFAANQGFRVSQGDYILLLNSDTIVTEHWLDRMLMCAESDPKIGLVGPLSNTASWQSVPEVLHNGDWAVNDPPSGYSVPDIARLVALSSGRVYPRITFLNGFCLLIKRSLLEEIGIFDESLFGKGYGEENDYCLRTVSAGWGAAIADDAYVFHAQSKSYSHDKRKALATHADRALRAKHGNALVDREFPACLNDRVLLGLRARAQVMFSRQALIEDGRRRWEGRRVAFVLPVCDAGGGANVVLNEARAMQRFGVEVTIVNLRDYKPYFGKSYPNMDLSLLWARSEDEVADLVLDFDAVIATAYKTVQWLLPLTRRRHSAAIGYYVQDFEPHFFSPFSAPFERALASYTELPGMKLITKTSWNQHEVRTHTGQLPTVVGASLDVDLFRPRVRQRATDDRVNVCAMVRPSSPRRAPEATMQILRDLDRRYGERIRINIFGVDDDALFQKLPRDFSFHDHGKMPPEIMTQFLSEQDITIDASTFQALGLLAMEAMASGSAVVVPQKGGTSSFAINGENALIVDTSEPKRIYDAVCRLIDDSALRRKMQERAIMDMATFHPEGVAANILRVLFSEQNSTAQPGN